MSDWLQTVLHRPPLEWMDLVDIAIVAVFFYQVLVLIRGTRAMQMAVGAGLVTFLYFLSRWLELEAVNWIIRNALGYVVIAVIVLFQRERALLEGSIVPVTKWEKRT